jgi:hypothetical protein
MVLNEDLIDEIGEYLGFKMWNKRDLSKEYDFPNARGEVSCLPGDNFVKGNIIIYNNIPLLVYKYAGCFHTFKSIYTLNIITIKPTKTSKNQKILSHELIEKIKTSLSLSTFQIFKGVKMNIEISKDGC